VAIFDEALVGLMDIEITAESATIEVVAVHPASTGGGIATALLDHVWPELKARGVATLDAWTREDVPRTGGTGPTVSSSATATCTSTRSGTRTTRVSPPHRASARPSARSCTPRSRERTNYAPGSVGSTCAGSTSATSLAPDGSGGSCHDLGRRRFGHSSSARTGLGVRPYQDMPTDRIGLELRSQRRSAAAHSSCVTSLRQLSTEPTV
jgi:hypothetical protein